MTEEVLLGWLGDADLRGAAIELPGRPRPARGPGPVAQAVEAAEYDRVVLLNNRGREFARPYKEWLRARTQARVEVRQVRLRDITDHGEIYEAVVPICEQESSRGARLTYHLAPGTPAMASVWMLLAKTRFPGAMIRSSPERGVESANVPFDISAELLRGPASELELQAREPVPEQAAFGDIIAGSREMQEAIGLATRIAVWPVSVLIEGESGTGKELFARAIHNASPRRDKPLVPVNCGAIPKDLVEAELFGHTRGAFTGATSSRAGFFEQADGGTLFLDELGELPLDAQVKLLRALDNAEVRRVGGDKVTKVDVRVVAATNRSLPAEIAKGAFREDLYYRLAVARIRLPPIRERRGDLTRLLEFAMAQANSVGTHNVPGYQSKTLSAGAKNLLMQHPWPGNVRELMGTVRRAAIWSTGTRIEKEDARRALLDAPRGPNETTMGRPLGDGFDLRSVMGEVARHYIGRALREGGTKKRAAELLNAPSYQTLTNWMTKYEVEG